MKELEDAKEGAVTECEVTRKSLMNALSNLVRVRV
jgi:hypothetical protein